MREEEKKEKTKPIDIAIFILVLANLILDFIK